MKTESRYSLVEILIAVAVVAICARYIWAKEIIELENSAIASLGLPIYSKYLLTVPLFALLVYGIYRRESFKARSEGRSLVRKSVILAAVILLAVAGVLLFAAGGIDA